MYSYLLLKEKKHIMNISKIIQLMKYQKNKFQWITFITDFHNSKLIHDDYFL